MIPPVSEAEFQRLLGYPPQARMEGLAAAAAHRAREWYLAHGRPWELLRTRSIARIEGSRVVLDDGRALTSEVLADRLRRAGAQHLVVAAFSAGEELDSRVAALWEHAPVDAFALDAFGSAVVEQQVRDAWARLRAGAAPRGETVLAHYSPGYTGWDLADQAALFQSLSGGDRPFPGSLELLPSGMLCPRKSLLAVFAVAPGAAAEASALAGCATCDLPDCGFRRSAVPDPPPAYPEKALARWARDLLSLSALPDQSIAASFLYEGNTCSNMGRPLKFRYEVILENRRGEYRIVTAAVKLGGSAGSCELMCAALREGAPFLVRVESERPFDGWSLRDALDDRGDVAPSGCLCSPENRRHKWRIVLHTIAYALRTHEKLAGSHR